MNPVEHPDNFDKYRLGGTLSPGVVTFSGHEDKTEWDVKESEGTDGASPKRKGDKPREFQASHYIVVDTASGIDEHAEFDEFAKIIKSTVNGNSPKALDIEHPDLARVGIKSVVKGTIGGFKHDGKGGATVVVTYLPYSPPKPKPVGGPVGSKTKAQTAQEQFDEGAAAILEIINNAKNPEKIPEQTLTENP